MILFSAAAAGAAVRLADEGKRVLLLESARAPGSEYTLAYRGGKIPCDAASSRAAELCGELRGLGAVASDGRIDHTLLSPALSRILMRRGDADRVNKLNGYLEEIGRSCDFGHWYFGSLHEDRVITERHTCVFKEMIPVVNPHPKKSPRTNKNADLSAKSNDIITVYKNLKKQRLKG